MKVEVFCCSRVLSHNKSSVVSSPYTSRGDDSALRSRSQGNVRERVDSGHKMQLVREACSMLAVLVAVLSILSRTASAFQAATTTTLSSSVAGVRRQVTIRNAVAAHGAGCVCAACSPARLGSCSCDLCRSGVSHFELFHPASCTCATCVGAFAHPAACACTACRGN